MRRMNFQNKTGIRLSKPQDHDSDTACGMWLMEKKLSRGFSLNTDVLTSVLLNYIQFNPGQDEGCESGSLLALTYSGCLSLQAHLLSSCLYESGTSVFNCSLCSDSVSFSGLPLLHALPGPDDVTTCAEAQRNQPAAIQLCGGAGRDQGGWLHFLGGTRNDHAGNCSVWNEDKTKFTAPIINDCRVLSFSWKF